MLHEAGVPEEAISIHWVPGSYELPLGAQWLADRDDIDGVICIGSVIRGETAHFDYVCSAAAQGILRVNQDSGKPVMFCVLTDDTREQAAARIGGEHGNKGVEAAVGLVEHARPSTDPLSLSIMKHCIAISLALFALATTIFLGSIPRAGNKKPIIPWTRWTRRFTNTMGK